jgi:N-acetylneuraminate synthase
MEKIKFIAEIGINHNGDMGVVKKLIDLASLCGCDFVKFQKRNPDMAVPESEKNKIKSTPWGKIKYIDYKKKIELNIDDYKEIDQYCKTKKIEWFASVWDLNSAEELKEISEITKIPSAKLNDKKLLKYVSNNFKKKIISTGMSTQNQIDRAVDILNPQVIMHTVSTYPTPVNELNLNYIQYLKSKYPNIEVGYSGHEYALATTFAAIGIGAKWIERHITLDRHMWGSDQLSSVEPGGLFQLMSGIRSIEKSLGAPKARKITKSERLKLKSLRS